MHAPFTRITGSPRRLLTTVAAAAALALPLAVATRAQTNPAPSTYRFSLPNGERETRVGVVGSIASTQKPAPAAKPQVRTLDLPFEKIAYQKSDLPGYQLTVQQCSACHSPEYVTYQPRTSPRAYWQATVDKMVKTFGAPLPAEQVTPIVDYLTKTYGAEAPQASK